MENRDLFNNKYEDDNGNPILLKISCDKNKLKDKKFDYKTLALMTYLTDISKGNYFYSTDISKNKEEVEELGDMKIGTLKKNIRKIITHKENNIVKEGLIANTIRRYDIEEDEQFVYIPKRILEILCKEDSNIIKLYVYLSSHLKGGGNIVYRKELANAIGLSEKSKSSLNRITQDYMACLISLNLVNIRVVENSFNYYKVTTYEDFIGGNDSIDKSGVVINEEEIDLDTIIPTIIPKNERVSENLREYFYIYLITELDTNMKYIGEHSTNNLEDGYMGSGTILRQNQKLKGLDNYKKDILQFCKDEKHMHEMERLWIEKYKAYENNDFYNLK